MIRKMLVGLDGSAGSHAATDLAIAWSEGSGAEITGLTIIDDRPGSAPMPTSVRIHSAGVRSYLDRVARMRDGATRFRDEFAARCSAAGARFTTRSETGDPVRVFVEGHEDFDLTLLAKETQFRWYATEDEPDDTIAKVLRHARRPLVAVPRQLPTGNTVVVAYDGSKAAADALQSFAESGLGAGRPVNVVSVAADSAPATRRAEEAARFLASHDLVATPLPVVTKTNEATAIDAVTDRVGAGMVVMGAHSRGRLWEWLDPSTTTRMLARSRHLLYLHRHAN